MAARVEGAGLRHYLLQDMSRPEWANATGSIIATRFPDCFDNFRSALFPQTTLYDLDEAFLIFQRQCIRPFEHLAKLRHVST